MGKVATLGSDMTTKSLSLFSIFAIVIAIVGILHSAGLVWDLYGLYDWYDTVLHFGGGLTAGVFALAVWRHFGVEVKGGHLKIIRSLVHLTWVLGVVSIISIVWELHEYGLDQIMLGVGGQLRQLSTADTMGDFVLDLLGGFVAYAVFRNGRV